MLGLFQQACLNIHNKKTLFKSYQIVLKQIPWKQTVKNPSLWSIINTLDRQLTNSVKFVYSYFLVKDIMLRTFSR